MNKIFIGKVVSTHGIKGEIRILSDFPYKDKVFIINNKIIIDDKEYIIKSYRVHKGYDMVTLDGFNNINDVLFLLKSNVYISEELLNLDDDEIKKCEEIAYSDNEDEGEFIKCTVTESQFPVDNYVTHNVVVKNQCGYEEYPGITVVLLDSSNFGNWIKVGFGLALLFVLF
jgi:hypothetical protein